MEDLATFIQSMSEKYGLLDPNHKTNAPLLPARKHSQNDSQNTHEKHFSSDPSWKCLSAFLNSHERDTNHEEITNKSPKKRHGEHAEADKEDRNLHVSNSSERNNSFSNMKTSDYIQNVSFLDELQNPSLSDDMESTAVSKVQLLDPDQEQGSSGQSSPFQEFLAEDEEEEFCNENGLVRSFDELPEKEDARWKTSELWFRKYCSSRNTPKTSSERSVRSDTKVRSLRDEEAASSNGDVQSLQEGFTSEIDGQGHDFVSTSDCERSGLSTQDFAEVLGNIEKGRERALQVNEKVEKLLEESGLGCGREREGKAAEDDVLSTRFSQKHYDPERAGKVFEKQVSLRVSYEDILTEHERLGQIHNDLEKAGASAKPAYQERGGQVFGNRVLCEEAAADEARLGQKGEKTRKMLEDSTWVLNKECLRAGRVSQETVLVGAAPTEFLPDDAAVGQAQESAEVESPSIQQRVSDIDEASRILLAQLDKSRSLLSPSQEHVKRSGHSTPKFSHRHQKLSLQEQGEGSHPVSPQEQKAHEKDSIIPSWQQHRKVQGERKDHVSLDEDITNSSRQQQQKGEREQHVSPRGQAYDEDSVLTSQQPRKDQARRGQYASPRQEEYDEGFIMPSRQHHPKEQEEGEHHVSPRQQAYYEDKIMPSREQHARQNSGEKQSEGDEGEELDSEVSYGGSYPNKDGEKEAIYLPKEVEGMDYEDIAKSWETEWEQEVLEASESRPSDDPKWSRINEMLSHNGFSPIRSSSPATEFEEQLYSVLAEVVTNYERREKLVQELLEESEDLRHAEDRNNFHTQQLECETDLVKQKLAASEQRAEVASEAAERNFTAVRRDCQRLESANANLVQRCSQLEHACRAKERALQKLQDKVREAMDRVQEERQRSKEKEMYEKLKHKVASAQRTNGEALEPNFLQRDLKPVQIVGIYERQRAIMEAEIATLRTENAQLCRDLCEKENLILSKVLGREDSKNAFELLHQQQQLQRKEKDDELNSKATVKDLEGSFHQLTLQKQELHPSNAHGGESYGEELLQKVCKLLQIDEPRYIIETMKGLLQVVDAIPRMEQFVGDVCNVVFCDGERLLPSGDDERTPEAVPGILQTWLQKLESSHELQEFKDTILRLVWERSQTDAPTEHAAVSCRVAASYVKNLVAESEYLCSKTSYREAEGVIKAEPQKLLHRVISHFQLDWNEGVQMLFEIPHLEGIMAMMNSVYIQCSEYHNFARALCSMLGLDKDAGPNTIISAVNSLLVT